MEDNSPTMSLLSHINELRTRLLVSVGALILTTVASFAFSQKMAEFLAAPIGGLSAMSSIDVTENVSAFMKISLLSGVILAFPVIIYEILAFIMPGLNPNERAWIWMVVPFATFFFAAGVAFTYYVMLPAALPFLLNFMGISTSPRPNNYFSFVTNLMFWVGVSFELPLVIYFLARLKIVNAKMLLKQWRIAIVVSAVLAAVITPTPDPVNMGLMMLPLMMLYLISIIFAVVAQRQIREKVKKPVNKLKLAFTLIILAVLVAGLVFALIRYPAEVKLVISTVGKTLKSWWNVLSGWYSVFSTFVSKYIGSD